MSSNEEKQQGRIKYLDVIKGICGLSVCMVHSIGLLEQPMAKLFLTFNMSLFFFVSGMLFYGKDMKKQPFLSFCAKRAKRLLIPQVALGVFELLATIAADVLILRRETLASIDYIKPFLSWFFPTLLFMEIVMWLMLRYLNKKQMVFSLVLCLILFLAFHFDFFAEGHRVLGALVFGVAGYLLRPSVDEYYKRGKFSGGVLFMYYSCAVNVECASHVVFRSIWK